MTAVEEAVPAMGTAPACRALGLPRASLYRRRRPPGVARARPAPPRALDAGERQAVLKTLHSERFIDAAPAQVHAALLDANGIVKLSGIAMIDPQHTGFARGLEPIILGVGQPDSA